MSQGRVSWKEAAKKCARANCFCSAGAKSCALGPLHGSGTWQQRVGTVWDMADQSAFIIYNSRPSPDQTSRAMLFACHLVCFGNLF